MDTINTLVEKPADGEHQDGTPRCDETGATTAEYAITTLAACGFAAILVLILKSDGVKDIVTSVISTALGMGQ